MTRITDFGVDLDEGWHVLPSGPVPEGWALPLATAAVGDMAVPEGGVEALARRLEAVKAAVDAAGARGASTAVLVVPHEEPVVQAMLTIVLGRGISAEAYDEQLDHVVEQVTSAQVMARQPVRAELPSGVAQGGHFLIGHLPQDDLAAGVHLEERVHLGVFPPECTDMIDVTAIAASIGLFEDFAAYVVDALQHLDITVGDA